MLKINLLTMNDINTIHDNIQQGINKESLKELAEKLKMQDENVSLSDVLDAIIDIIPSAGGSSQQITMILGDVFENKTAEEAAEIFGITNEQFERLVTGRYCSALEKDVAASYLVTVEDDGDKVYFFSGDSSGLGCSYSLKYSNGLYTLNEV